MTGCIAQHPIYTNYGSKEDGTIINLKFKRTVKPGQRNSGYRKINPCMFGKTKSFSLHRFIYECFKGDIPVGYEIDHIDNDKHNNHIDNLQALSSTDNKKKIGEAIRKRKHKILSIPILAIYITTDEEKTFDNISSASKELEVDIKIILDILNKDDKAIKSIKGHWLTFQEI